MKARCRGEAERYHHYLRFARQKGGIAVMGLLSRWDSTLSGALVRQWRRNQQLHAQKAGRNKQHSSLTMQKGCIEVMGLLIRWDSTMSGALVSPGWSSQQRSARKVVRQK